MDMLYRAIEEKALVKEEGEEDVGLFILPSPRPSLFI
jgi:hypothetical protein